MIHSASPQSTVKIYIVLVEFEKWGQMDGQTTCMNIVITTGRDCGRPGGSKGYHL